MIDDEMKAWLKRHGVETPEQATGRPTHDQFIANANDDFGFAWERETDTVTVWIKAWHDRKLQTRFKLDDLRQWVKRNGRITPDNFSAAILGAKGWAV